MNYITPSPNREDPPDNYPLPDVQFLTPYDTGYNSSNHSNSPSPESNNHSNVSTATNNDNSVHVYDNYNYSRIPNNQNRYTNNHNSLVIRAGQGINNEEIYSNTPSSPKNLRNTSAQMPSSPKNIRNNQLSPYNRRSNNTAANYNADENCPNNDTPPNSPRKPVTCMGADISGLVRRVKTMRVAMTSETCV